jgi:hypothetical protein
LINTIYLREESMNMLKVSVGVFLLVLPVLFGIVLPGILIVVLPSLSMISGIVLFLDGIGAFSTREKEELNQLEVTILRMLSQGSKVESISSSTGVSALVIEQKIKELQKKGYLLGDKLTEKGFQAL